MSLSMHRASVPAFVQILSALSVILDKAAAHCAAKKIDPEVLLNARLFPDMLPFTRQVQIACDFAKNSVARLSGVEAVKFADDEKTFDELKARVTKTIDLLKAAKPELLDGSETRDVTVPIAGQPVTFKGEKYLMSSVLPNFFFHATTAYGILRHNGVELGKHDFLGPR